MTFILLLSAMRFNLWLLVFGGVAVIVEAVIEEIVKEKVAVFYTCT